jgi:hypothetical protein
MNAGMSAQEAVRRLLNSMLPEAIAAYRAKLPLPRLAELERENARLREALTEIARVDVGGLQGISEDHYFDQDDYSPEEAYERLKTWRDEEVQYLMGRIADRRRRARAALIQPSYLDPNEGCIRND